MPIQPIETHSSLIETPRHEIESPEKMIPSLTLYDTPETHQSSSSGYTSASFSSSSSVASSENSSVGVKEVSAKVGPVMTEHKRQEIAGEHKPEPLLEENPGRFVLFPIQNPEVRNFL